MLIAVAGATGTVGAPIAGALEGAGHEVRRLSRGSESHPVDLATGAGLAEALAGVDVVVDASNGGPAPDAAREVLIEGGGNLLTAAREAGVGHHVCLSIVGIDETPMAYYRVKLEQEDLVRASGVPFTIVRATQFHHLVAFLFESAARYRVLPGVRAKVQPCDPAEVAGVVASVAAGEPNGGIVTVGGPEVRELRDLAGEWRTARGRRAAVLPLPFPTALGRALKSGSLTVADPDHRLTRTFADWLADG